MKKDNKGRNLKENESQMSDGRYRYRYTDVNGKRNAVYSWKLVSTDKTPQGKKEDNCLRDKIKEIKKDLSDGIDIMNSQITVVQAIDRYLETKKKLSLSTINNYKHLAEKNVKSNKLGDMLIGNVKKSDILRYYAFLYKERNFKESTIQLYQNLLYPAFQLCVDDGLIRLNPCKNCMKDYARGGLSSDKKPLSAIEQKNLLVYVKNDKTYGWYYTLITFMLGTGCRISETLGITWDDINIQEKYIDINHQIIYKKKDGKIQYYAAPPKNKNTRRIPLQDDLVSIIKKYKNESYFLSLSSGFEVDGYRNFVFINNNGKLKTPNTIVRTFHSISDNYNKNEEYKALEEDREIMYLSEFTPHTLRHTYCTRMAENGIDIKVLQEIMGHMNIQITMQVYNHVTDERSQLMVQSLPSVLASGIK